MRIDEIKIVPGTAYAFRAFGGGYGVKVAIGGKFGERKYVNRVKQEFLFGSFPEATARQLVDVVNGLDPEKKYASQRLIERARPAKPQKATA